jgi:hypothetical protein
MKVVHDCFKSFDFISYSPSLMTQTKTRFRTSMGGAALLFLIALYITGILYFSRQIYNRINPELGESSSIENDPPERVLTNSDFAFMMALNDPMTYSPYIDESIYTAEYWITTVKDGALAEYRRLKTEKCSLKNFSGVDKLIFAKDFNFQNFYCI